MSVILCGTMHVGIDTRQLFKIRELQKNVLIFFDFASGSSFNLVIKSAIGEYIFAQNRLNLRKLITLSVVKYKNVCRLVVSTNIVDDCNLFFFRILGNFPCYF